MAQKKSLFSSLQDEQYHPDVEELEDVDAFNDETFGVDEPRVDFELEDLAEKTKAITTADLRDYQWTDELLQASIGQLLDEDDYTPPPGSLPIPRQFVEQSSGRRDSINELYAPDSPQNPFNLGSYPRNTDIWGPRRAPENAPRVVNAHRTHLRDESSFESSTLSNSSQRTITSQHKQDVSGLPPGAMTLEELEASMLNKHTPKKPTMISAEDLERELMSESHPRVVSPLPPMPIPLPPITTRPPPIPPRFSLAMVNPSLQLQHALDSNGPPPHMIRGPPSGTPPQPGYPPFNRPPMNMPPAAVQQMMAMRNPHVRAMMAAQLSHHYGPNRPPFMRPPGGEMGPRSGPPPHMNPAMAMRFANANIDPSTMMNLMAGHARMQDLARRQQQDIVYEQKRGRGRDPYCGLMSKREKEWLVRIMTIPMQTVDAINDDYYYRLHKYGREISELMKRCRLEGATDDSFVHNEEEIEHDASLMDKYVPPTFAGALGKLQTLSASSPRQLIDVQKRVRTNSSGSPGNQSPVTISVSGSHKFKALLIEIENMWSILLKAESRFTQAVIVPEASPDFLRRETMINEGRQLASAVCEQIHNMNESLPLFLSVRKGRSLLSRLLSSCNKDEVAALLLLIYTHLHILAKKDTAEESCLPSAVRDAVRCLSKRVLERVICCLNVTSLNCVWSCNSKCCWDLLLGLLCQAAKKRVDCRNEVVQAIVENIFEGCVVGKLPPPPWMDRERVCSLVAWYQEAGGKGNVAPFLQNITAML